MEPEDDGSEQSPRSDDLSDFSSGSFTTRVAPLHTVSIPCLELMSAAVGLRLAEAVRNILNLPKHK